MERYITVDDYKTLTNVGALSDMTDAEINKCIDAADREIDVLTFNRIHRYGFETLTEYQHAMVKQAAVDQMDFKAQYGVYLDNPLASFGINGISMSWDSSKVMSVSGVYTSAVIYSYLLQTGLAYRGLGA